MSDVHRDHPDLSEEDAARLQLLGPRGTRPVGHVEATCDCGATFTRQPAPAGRAGSKWYRLCPSCLSDHT